MAPQIVDGETMVFDKTEEPKPGDLVIIWFKPGSTPEAEHQCMFKRLYLALPPIPFPYEKGALGGCEPLVIVEMINPPRRLRFEGSSILGVHKCVGMANLNGDGTARMRHPSGDEQ